MTTNRKQTLHIKGEKILHIQGVAAPDVIKVDNVFTYYPTDIATCPYCEEDLIYGFGTNPKFKQYNYCPVCGHEVAGFL